MINVGCTCGVREDVPESQVSKNWLCPSCGKTTHLACAEPLADGAGAGDFDASITIAEGPARVGERFLLGGVADIELGSLRGKHIFLPGQQTSQSHCVLRRVDFGPSKWAAVDAKSENGTFVNSARANEQELASGDRLTVGDFELLYEVEAAEPPPAMAVPQGAVHAGTHDTHQATSAASHAPHLTPYPSSHHSQPPTAAQPGFFKRLFGRK